jgi:hypothetical protein
VRVCAPTRRQTRTFQARSLALTVHSRSFIHR